MRVGRADDSKRFERHVHGPRADALAEGDVDAKIFHRRVHKLFDRLGQAVDFVDEQYRPGAGLRQVRQQIFGRRQSRAAGDLQWHVERSGNASGERRLAQPRWAVEQDVAQRFLPNLRGFDRDHQPIVDLPLTNHILQPLGPQRNVVLGRQCLRRGDRRRRRHIIGGKYRFARH